MFLLHFLGFSIFKIFHTWSSYVDSKITIYNTLCWYSGKDTGLSPGRPQFKSRHHQGFLQKDLPWKFFKKWLSIRRITIWITSRSQSLPTLLLCFGVPFLILLFSLTMSVKSCFYSGLTALEIANCQITVHMTLPIISSMYIHNK